MLLDLQFFKTPNMSQLSEIQPLLTARWDSSHSASQENQGGLETDALEVLWKLRGFKCSWWSKLKCFLPLILRHRHNHSHFTDRDLTTETHLDELEPEFRPFRPFCCPSCFPSGIKEHITVENAFNYHLVRLWGFIVMLSSHPSQLPL